MHVSQSFPPPKAVQTALSILLVVCAFFKPSPAYSSHIEVHQAAKGVNINYDELADLLESIDHLLNPLDIYAHILPTPAMDEMMVKIMAELLSILALMTKELKQGRQSESVLAVMLH